MNLQAPTESALRALTILATLTALPAGLQAALEIPTVLVGNPGNAADSLTGLGKVDYPYELGKYEVTNAQFCEFANACTGKDAYPSLVFSASELQRAIKAGGGIEMTEIGSEKRGGTTIKTYRFAPVPGRENHPFRAGAGLTDVLATDFIKWMNDGADLVEKIDGGTVMEKQKRHKLDAQKRVMRDEKGKVILEDVEVTRQVIMLKRKAPGEAGSWYLADANELFKAAFHDATAGTHGVYFNFATGANIAPAPASSETKSLKVNAAGGGFPKDNNDTGNGALLAVGASSPSPYGVFDLTGNAAEVYFTGKRGEVPQGYLLPGNVAETFGGGFERFAGLQCRASSIHGDLSWSRGNTQFSSYARADEASGFRLVRIKPSGAAKAAKPASKLLAPHVAMAKDGDLWFFELPATPAILRESAKEPYHADWEWARETIARMAGKTVRPRSETEAQAYAAKFQRKDASGNITVGVPLFIHAAQLETNTSGAKCKPVFDFSDRKSVAEVLQRYNRLAPKANQVEADSKRLSLNTSNPLHPDGQSIDREIFIQSRIKQAGDVTKFEQKVMESLKAGTPLMWSADFNLLDGGPNTETTCALIIGANPKTHEIICTTNPYRCAPANMIRRISAADAYACTLGLYQVQL